jgi:hypothetical protein
MAWCEREFTLTKILRAFCEHEVPVLTKRSQSARKICERHRKLSEAIRQIFTKKSWTFG